MNLFLQPEFNLCANAWHELSSRWKLTGGWSNLEHEDRVRAVLLLLDQVKPF